MEELSHMLLHQMASFNSPVWFNVGVKDKGRKPQCSACFINSVEDSMESILGLAKTEGMLFKGGSGTGTNLSPLRSSKELLAGGGTASGPVSFMKGFDAFAGVIKSGGKTRRAAKMVVLDGNHPDIMEFINCKAHEEKKAWALIAAGYDGKFNGEAYQSISFQNANNSVRLTDEFFTQVTQGHTWATHKKNGEIAETLQARDMFRAIAEATHLCGDPGIQYDGAIQKWHTCKTTGRINASNPCSEFVFLDDTACNLASLNLMKFYDTDTKLFDIDGFQHAVDLFILAQEILVDMSSYPTERIAHNSHAFRPLGLGYCNLGALLMAKGLAYDSEKGRDFAAAITSLMGGRAYLASAMLATTMGAFAGYAANQKSMLDVIALHEHEARKLSQKLRSVEGALIAEAGQHAWYNAKKLGNDHGFRNAQVTVLAPTGTIAFMMDADTTGIEPDIALIKYKSLVGGGSFKIVNQSVRVALENLGYQRVACDEILAWLNTNDTIEGAPLLRNDDLPVFDCAFKPAKGKRSISWEGHIKMMAAVQPFLSGAISKTVNLPNDATVEDIEKAYMMGWKMGLKAIAVYRDGCKCTQPLNVTKDAGSKSVETDKGIVEAQMMMDKQIVQDVTMLQAIGALPMPTPQRRRLPDERKSVTHKFDVAGHEGYITAGMYDDGSLGEIFITMAKEGSTVSGLIDSFAVATSLALQNGVSVKTLVEKFSHTRFEPSGWTQNKQIPNAKSIIDYLFRWIAMKFLTVEGTPAAIAAEMPALKVEDGATFVNQSDAPACSVCGSIMVRNGSCYLCRTCATTSGCS
jgi:ribonucleoside-diphosphate reductase alpha chain